MSTVMNINFVSGATGKERQLASPEDWPRTWFIVDVTAELMIGRIFTSWQIRPLYE